MTTRPVKPKSQLICIIINRALLIENSKLKQRLMRETRNAQLTLSIIYQYYLIAYACTALI